VRLAASRTHAALSFSRDTAAESGTSPTHPFNDAIANLGTTDASRLFFCWVKSVWRRS